MYQQRNLSVTNKSVRIILIDCLCSLLLRSRDSVELTLLADKSLSRQTIKLVRHLTFNVHITLDTLIEHQFKKKTNVTINRILVKNSTRESIINVFTFYRKI